MRALAERFRLVKCHMGRFGLRLPGSDKLIRKPTLLLVSDDSVPTLARECPGSKHPRHCCHQTIAGSHPGVGSISTFAGRYTPQFVQAVLETVHLFVQAHTAHLVECQQDTEPSFQEVLMFKADLEDPQATDDQLLQVLDHLRRNLGHPPGHDLFRILKHAQASDRAL